MIKNNMYYVYTQKINITEIMISEALNNIYIIKNIPFKTMIDEITSN